MPTCLPKQKAGSWGIWSVGQILLLRSLAQKTFPSKNVWLVEEVLSQKPHTRFCAFETVPMKNPNILAVWFQEPPRKIWFIEFTLKEATVTELLEELPQLFWVSNLNYSTFQALCAYTEQAEKHNKVLLVLDACVIWCDKFRWHLLPHNLLYFCFVFLVLRQISGEIN